MNSAYFVTGFSSKLKKQFLIKSLSFYRLNVTEKVPRSYCWYFKCDCAINWSIINRNFWNKIWCKSNVVVVMIITNKYAWENKVRKEPYADFLTKIKFSSWRKSIIVFCWENEFGMFIKIRKNNNSNLLPDLEKLAWVPSANNFNQYRRIYKEE